MAERLERRMSMKKLYAAMAALVVISVVGTAVLIVFMPDTVPAHYNFAGEIDRWGSKYENFAFPAIAVLIDNVFGEESE